MASQVPAGDELLPIRVQVAEPPTADFKGNAVFFSQDFLKIFLGADRSGGFFNGVPEKIFLCLELRFPWRNAVGNHLLIETVHLFLPSAPCMVFPVCDFLFCRGEQVNLVELLPVAQIHHILFQIKEIIFREMMFISGTGIAWPFHEALPLHVILPQAVDHDMHMDVAAFIVAVCVGADQSLMAGKIFPGIFQAELLRPLPGQIVLCHILWIET